ncbi:hypothetical protein E2C01_059224 [Portunus trituberculatus]|uniref:Uncharacterized protein n=1 Tax=Portunus trituberculatus TaxID=210409 RepID=A0A5B7H7R3_PORTR|nr:hypothetical protein [Portunus trituberculatus]
MIHTAGTGRGTLPRYKHQTRRQKASQSVCQLPSQLIRLYLVAAGAQHKAFTPPDSSEQNKSRVTASGAATLHPPIIPSSSLRSV